jgi:uncharacterized protein
MAMKAWRMGVTMLCALLLLGCVAESAPGQKYDAARYFDGPGLALAQAVGRHDSADLRRLIEAGQVDPNKVFSRQGMPLMAWPIVNEDPDGLQLLLDAGLDPNARDGARDQDGDFVHANALVYAASLKDPVYLKLLLEHGGDPETPNRDGQPLLFDARLQGSFQNVKLLVEHGADVNHSFLGATGTILGQYVLLGDFEEAYWLMQHGADPGLRSDGSPVASGTGFQSILEDVFYLPVQPRVAEWQRKCQRWALDHGYTRPPLPEHLRQRREQLKLSVDERQIPQG